MRRIQPGHRDFARSLRSSSTDAERLVWSRLRGQQLHGAKFRRQHPLGRYVLDFVCLEASLVIELDGSQHAESKHDALRDAWLAEQGLRVLRFWNSDVMRNIDGVLEVVMRAVAAPPPQPSPLKGEGA